MDQFDTQFKKDAAEFRKSLQHQQQNKLDQLWAKVNALGGTSEIDIDDEYARGINETVGLVLDMIEAMGGMDPEVRKLGD